ncbi:unnamed protein product [Allacma fusca]|uniref:C2H2-type domain-containing protein n=1 Tax=Allacma fusca TaxID=39272 RepID=A0A8J2P445_9HEXA|nr:unnamed protein product [Allacma fusca]
MRKRNKTSRGSRAFAARSARGNSRAASSSGNSKSVNDSSHPSSLSSNRGASTRGRRGKSDNYDQISSHSNGFTLRLPEQYYRNRNGVSSMSSSVLAARTSSNSISSDYYLHKKFKKLTTTTSTSDVSKTKSETNNGSGAVVAPPEGSTSASASDIGDRDASKNINNNNVSINNHKLFSQDVPSIKELGEKFMVSAAVIASPATRNPSSGISITSSQSIPISGSSSSTSEVVGVSCSSSSVSTSSETPTISSTSSVVYKPKFRIAAETVEDTGSSSETSSSAHSVGGGDGLKPEQKPVPGKLNGEKRMDRQSLDDRISKIIDENQSILSTWPEHLTKKLKSHVQRHQQQLQQQQQQQLQQISQLTQRNNTMVIMSGGSATESPLALTGFNSPTPPTGIKLRPIELTTVPVSPPLLLRSHSDAGGLYNTSVTTAELSPHISLKAPGVATTTESYPQSDQALLSVSSTGSSSSTVVPKKRRRLSPTPSRLCGGEVAELPTHEPLMSVPGNKAYYQDVDMTVRVSNCGTSGAKVTIRTNGSSSNNSVINYNRLIDVPSSPLKMPESSSSSSSSSSSIVSDQSSLFIRATPTPISFEKGLPEKDSVNLPAPSPPNDLKIGKPRGRPPKKGRTEPLQIISNLTSVSPASDPSSKLRALVSPPSTFPNAAITATTNTTTTTTTSGASRIPFPSGVLSPQQLSLSPPSNLIKVESVKTEIEENEKDTFVTPKVTGVSGSTSPKPLLLQSSTPNPKRPTFLALKPVNAFTKKSEPGVLPSPETPRGARTYSQMYINGHAYTYLGFKVSTRSSYTCLYKPQPMFLPQETDPKLSMYSNWQPRSRNKSQDDVRISLNDSRVNGRRSPRSFLYTSAKRDCGTETVNSPDSHKSLWSILDGSEASPKSDPSPPVSTGPSASTSLPVEVVEAIDLQVPGTTVPDRKSLLVETSSSFLSLSPSPRKSSVISTYSDVGSIVSRPIDFSAESNGSTSSTSNGKPCKSAVEPIMAGNSSSECSSMDESSNSHFERFSSHRVKHSSQGEKGISNGLEGPLSLTTSQSQEFCPSGSISQDEPDDEKSLSIMGNRFENPRVRIMEGGFESNEDYTYVRGRGRGRYVCEACGIRCKKPSMLRKHLKTHTDLRPYTCKLCNFSFKTKGNLTKHQKSKSHHKKCLGLGIHPNSSRSLAMIGPQFSDTNDTDDSDDDDDNGCDNGDTDSQDEMDGEDMSSSAEPDTLESHSVEKEIAQSLLDLSKISRIPTDCDAAMDDSSSKVLGFPIPSKVTNISSLTPERRNGYRNFPIDENSSSQESNTTEAPIDLSCRSNKPNSLEAESDFKKLKLERSPYIRSFGVVGEAQRWEPEEEFAITGCLNLKKVPNESSNCRNFSDTVNGYDLSNHNGGIPINVDVKPEIRSLNLNNNNIPAGESSFDFKQKRRRESSTSSSCGDGFPSLLRQSPLQQPTGPVNLQNSNNPNSSQKQPKLHQPWLSPQGPSKPPPDVVVKQDVDNFSKIPPPPVNGNILERKFLDTVEPTMLPAVSLEQPRSGQMTSPTSMFSGVVGSKRQAEFREPSGPQALVKDEGKAECNVCGKVFARASQLNLHMNIHYLERPFRCDPCGVSFRTKGHLIKHRRSSSHDCKVKVYLTESWGVANEENPRPFKCPDCKIAFRIHGHLAKHLRSKMHIMRMECLGKLPFGIYFEMEKCGLNLTEIDTSDCDMSLISLQGVAKKIYGDSWTERLTVPMEEPV